MVSHVHNKHLKGYHWCLNTICACTGTDLVFLENFYYDWCYLINEEPYLTKKKLPPYTKMGQLF